MSYQPCKLCRHYTVGIDREPCCSCEEVKSNFIRDDLGTKEQEITITREQLAEAVTFAGGDVGFVDIKKLEAKLGFDVQS